MTAATEIQSYKPSFSPNRAPSISQATAIEQQRAIAEVQAAVVVAQNCPRDLAAAEAEMEYVCGRMDMAEQAFYQVTNRGTGPSVHLMRELARIWGNIDYGVRELARNDERGESEVQAFAWDQQRNTRSSRTFINPHQRMAKVAGVKQRVALDDLQDIYLSNNNIGARAVRECIATILPRWFTEKAQNVCRRTLEHGEGKPLQDRVAAIVKAFHGLGVTEKQLEVRVGKARGQWDAGDIAQLTVAGQSIRRGEVPMDELFPPLPDETSTADEISTPTDAAAEKPKRGRKPRGAGIESDERRTNLNVMFVLFAEAGVGKDDRAERLTVTSEIVGETITSSTDLTDPQLFTLNKTLREWKQAGELAEKVGTIIDTATLRAEGLAEQATLDEPAVTE